MNIFSTLRNNQKTLIITGSLLFGLALTPIAANAGQHHSGHHNKHDKRADRHYYVVEEHGRHNHRKHKHHKAKKHYREAPRYVVINNDHHHYSEPSRLQIGVHTGDFDIVFRD